jgi:hypothetical protein
VKKRVNAEAFPMIEERNMSSAPGRKITGKIIALVIFVAIATSVVVTVIQLLLLGDSYVAVTGGVVGAVMAAMAISILKKRPE